jgi:hypothetical protein
MTQEVIALGLFNTLFPWVLTKRLQHVDARSPTWNVHEWDLAAVSGTR